MLGKDGHKNWVPLTATFARIPLAILFAFLIEHHGKSFSLAVVLVLVVLELTDIADGIIARCLKVASEYGAILDPFADSFARLVVYWAIAKAGLALSLVPLIMALRDITVAYSRLVMMHKGVSVAARVSGKVKAVTQGISAFFMVLGPLYWPTVGDWPIEALSWLVITVTAASACEYVLAAVRAALAKTS